MSKKWRKAGCLLCAGFMAMNIAACGGGSGNGDKPGIDPDRPVDTSKAQLHVSNFNGGYGTEWLYIAIERFEELYKDKVFMENTVGVQVHVDTNKGAPISFTSERNEIFFTENCNYYDRLSMGELYDITEWVNEPLTEFGETESIADKLPDVYDDYFKTSNGKYYGLPHYRRINTITYDVDLFDEKALFFDEEGELTKTSADEGLGHGPDGKKGTWDDGQPATYEQFYKLCDEMKKRGVDPIVWSGGIDFYTTQQLAGLKADFEGAESNLFYNFDGTATKLIDKINSDGTITYKAPTKITESNGYELYNSAGFYYALDFLNTLMDNGYATDDSFNEAVSHTDAQTIFLLSKYNTKANPIGMLVEGNYWIHESSATFQQMENRYPNSSLDERRLALMAYPKATADLVGKDGLTLLDNSGSLACVNANLSASKKELVKTFFQFLHTDESLCEFTKVTGTTRGFDYELSENDYKGLNHYVKSMYDLMSNAEMTICMGSSSFFYKNYSKFTFLQQFATNDYVHPVAAFDDGKSTVQVFNEIKNKYNATTWAALTK